MVKGFDLSSHRLLSMSLQGSYLCFYLWMFLGTTLALGQGQGKEAMPPLPAEELCYKPLTCQNSRFPVEYMPTEERTPTLSFFLNL